MADDGDEFRFQLRRLFSQFLGLFQFVFGALALGDVGDGTDQPEGPTVRPSLEDAPCVNPPPVAVVIPMPVFGGETLLLALQSSHEPVAEEFLIIGVNSLRPTFP